MSEKTKRRDWPRLLIAGGLAALVPKCLACVAGYLAMGAGLAAQTPELCGAVANDGPGQDWLTGVAVAVAFAWLCHHVGGALLPDRRAALLQSGRKAPPTLQQPANSGVERRDAS